MDFQLHNKLSLAYKDRHLHDRWLRIVGIPLIGFLTSFFGIRFVEGMQMESFPATFLQMIVFTFVTWETCRRILLSTRKNYPGLKNTSARIFRSFSYYTIGVAVISFLFITSSNVFHFYSFFRWETFSSTMFFFTALAITYSLGVIYEGNYFFRHWKKSTIETGQLKRENLEAQFESLKNQVNPHFLFNSLNTLSSLIEEDTEKAEQFVQEMSEVYRYLLQSNDKPLTTIEAELDFIDAYFFLLRTRFGTNLTYEINVPEKFMQYHIPPLTLQILVENAVKHNVVSSGKPLKIKILTNDRDELVVSNNLQLKTQPVLSNKVGLNNIFTKYKLLNQPDITVKETGNIFEVCVPLIQEYYEEIPVEIKNSNNN